jgi:hypothetical protein
MAKTLAVKTLVVVESPAKAKTIEKYLGKGFKVKASVGHIKDLPKSKLGVDVKKNFEPTYEVITSKKKVVEDLRKAASAAIRTGKEKRSPGMWRKRFSRERRIKRRGRSSGSRFIGFSFMKSPRRRFWKRSKTRSN